ncbi:MAG: putative MPP superfamily phosphohydrolase, partial [Candidatus Paceibacteria bacterium]
ARFLAAGRFHERRETILVADLPAGLEGFTIAQLSDLHAGPFLGEGDLQHVVRRINELQVDLVALTGDYITHHVTDAFCLAPDLGALRSRHGTFAVFGNHDYRGRREQEIVDCFGAAGVRFLRNEGVRLDSKDGVLHLAGVEDLEEAKQIDPAAARASMRPGDVGVLLCHNPAGAAQLAREDCALMLSGHTHGGQLNHPLIPKLGPRHPGNRVQHAETTCIVSRGLGVIAIPFRIQAPAELVLISLRRGSAS